MVELVDARDSKSRVPWERVGSIPTAGTNDFNKIGTLKGSYFFMQLSSSEHGLNFYWIFVRTIKGLASALPGSHHPDPSYYTD